MRSAVFKIFIQPSVPRALKGLLPISGHRVVWVVSKHPHLKVLFIFRGRGREEERERETSMFEKNIDELPLVHALGSGPNPKPRHVLWPGIKLATFRFAG